MRFDDPGKYGQKKHSDFVLPSVGMNHEEENLLTIKYVSTLI